MRVDYAIEKPIFEFFYSDNVKLKIAPQGANLNAGLGCDFKVLDDA